MIELNTAAIVEDAQGNRQAQFGIRTQVSDGKRASVFTASAMAMLHQLDAHVAELSDTEIEEIHGEQNAAEPKINPLIVDARGHGTTVTMDSSVSLANAYKRDGIVKDGLNAWCGVVPVSDTNVHNAARNADSISQIEDIKNQFAASIGQAQPAQDGLIVTP